MDLYFLRHAIAVPRGAPGYARDSDRPLTEEGEKKMYGVARGMKTMALQFDLILSSPFVRAKRTSEIVAEIFDAKKLLAFSKNLETNGNPQALINELVQRRAGAESVLLVGHEPYLSNLISMLLSGGTTVSMMLKKGGLCKLGVPVLHYGQCATLEWFLTPAQLREMQKERGRRKT